MAGTTTNRRPPWHVPGLPRPRTAARTRWWRYVVLEEIVDDVALLRRWRWPLADERGHLVWEDEEQLDSTTIPVASLREQLYRPSGLERSPRIGDTFAVITDSPSRRWRSHAHNVAPLFSGRVFDVSAEARLAARLAYQGSVAAVLPSAPPPTPGHAGSATVPRRFTAPELTVLPAAPARRSAP
jgi:hypothetical protein